MTITSKKLSTGLYQTEVKGRTFLIERVEDGTWQLCELVDGRAEYWNHFVAKADALSALKEMA